jgi:hypothetical protein
MLLPRMPLLQPLRDALTWAVATTTAVPTITCSRHWPCIRCRSRNRTRASQCHTAAVHPQSTAQEHHTATLSRYTPKAPHEGITLPHCNGTPPKHRTRPSHCHTAAVHPQSTARGHHTATLQRYTPKAPHCMNVPGGGGCLQHSAQARITPAPPGWLPRWSAGTPLYACRHNPPHVLCQCMAGAGRRGPHGMGQGILGGEPAAVGWGCWCWCCSRCCGCCCGFSASAGCFCGRCRSYCCCCIGCCCSCC